MGCSQPTKASLLMDWVNVFSYALEFSGVSEECPLSESAVIEKKQLDDCSQPEAAIKWSSRVCSDCGRPQIEGQGLRRSNCSHSMSTSQVFAPASTPELLDFQGVV